MWLQRRALTDKRYLCQELGFRMAPTEMQDARFGDSDFEGLMNFDEWEPDEAACGISCGLSLCRDLVS